MAAPGGQTASGSAEADGARWVRVEPAAVTFAVEARESVIAAAWRAGLQWPTTCWGQAECGVCAMEVLEGVELLSPVGPAEAGRLRALPRRDGAGRRLACQAKVVGPGTVTVRKPGVRTRAPDGSPPA
jgi:2Fe-2S ferredoxin